MYVLQVFRTESKDYLEAFSKIEAFIKSNNSNAGSSISKESTNKIKSKLDSLVDHKSPDPKKYNLIDTPYKGESVDDFKSYLSKFIKEYHFGYSSEIGELADELEDIDEDDEAEILREINWEMEDCIEGLSDVKEIVARICGCISQDNEIHNYPVEGRDNININEFSGHLNPSEWSISVLDKLFKDASGNKNFDILKDEWEVISETGLFNIDEGDVSENQKTFFIIAYVREDG